jgi:ribosome-binding protein aMBF1 (putative translation factor)
MTEFYPCDACGRLTDRLHYLIATGLDTAVCDQCAGYDAEAADEAWPPRYRDEYPEGDPPDDPPF